MAGHCRQIGGLALCLVGVIGVCVVCGLPMWRETSFVGANIITAQSVWDGLWMHCILQATGQMQCKKHTSAITMTTDIQAGRVLTLLSIILGLLGFTITLLGGGVVNCSGQPIQPIYTLTESNMSGTSSKAKAALLGGLLCILAGVLVLVSVSWSAAFTISAYNDPLVVAALRREVGSAIYIGWGSTLFLLLGGTLICLVCGAKRSPRDPSYRTYLSYGYNPSPALITPSITPYTRSEFSYDPGTLDRRMGNKIYSPGVEPRGRSQSTDPNWSDQSRTPFLGPQTNPAMLLHDAPIRNSVMPDKYYVAHAF